VGKHGNLVFALGVAGVMLAVVLGYVFILGAEHAPPTPPPAAVPALPVGAAELARASGVVEIRLGSGEWRVVRAGARLEPDTEVRTGISGTAALTYGDGLDVELSADSEVRLQMLEASRARFQLRAGRVVADVRPESGRVVQVGVRDSAATAETRDGRLHILTDGSGSMQAAVTRGSASVSALGKRVEIPAGYQTSIRPGHAPLPAMAVPTSLLLKVKWPPESETKKRRHLVIGTANPGARVRIGGTTVSADPQGRFRAVIELREGDNRLEVRAVDVTGRTEMQRSPPIRLDTRGPSHAFDTDPGMWRPKTPE
jgi:hypothetical protein